MKKLISIILVLIMIAGLAACGNSEKELPSPGASSSKNNTSNTNNKTYSDAEKFLMTGTWYTYSIISDGEEIIFEDVAGLLGYNGEEFLKINIYDNGTFYIVSMDEESEGTWTSSNSTSITLTLEGEPLDAVYDGEYLVLDLDEETTVKLTDKAPSAASEESNATLDFLPPSGWKVSDDDPTIYYSPDYPNDSSNITVVISESDPYFSLYSPEFLKTYFEEAFLSAFGEETEVTIDEFENLTISSQDACRMKYHFTVNGVAMTQLQYAINSDMFYSVTYTEVSGADWMSEFESSASTIELIYDSAI